MGAALSGQEFEYLDGSQSFKTDLAARLCTICRPAAVIFLAYLINKLSEQKTAHSVKLVVTYFPGRLNTARGCVMKL